MKTNTARKIDNDRDSGSFTVPAHATHKTPKSVTTRELGVVDQVRAAFAPKARLATFLGCLLGGFVPVATFVVAHYEVDTARLGSSHSVLSIVLVLGGLLFSAKTVYGWGKLAFQAPAKAFGFVILTEGVMTLAQTSWLSVAALIYLVAINGIATGCTLSLKRS
jgi:hypothetical protein